MDWVESFGMQAESTTAWLMLRSSILQDSSRETALLVSIAVMIVQYMSLIVGCLVVFMFS